jgi:hypothetical protein
MKHIAQEIALVIPRTDQTVPSNFWFFAASEAQLNVSGHLNSDFE